MAWLAVSLLDCPESVTGHDSMADGRCVWCRKQVDPPVPAPRGYPPSELGVEYRRMYDPDFGSDPYDV